MLEPSLQQASFIWLVPNNERPCNTYQSKHVSSCAQVDSRQDAQDRTHKGCHKNFLSTDVRQRCSVLLVLLKYMCLTRDEHHAKFVASSTKMSRMQASVKNGLCNLCNQSAS